MGLQQHNAVTQVDCGSSSPTNDKPLDTEICNGDETVADTPIEDRKAWVRLFAAWLLLFISWGPAVSFGEFASFYITDLLKENSTTSIAWIGSVSTFLLVATGSITGPLFDRGYLKHLLYLGLVLLVCGYMTLSLSTKYWHVLLSQGICVGFGSGLIFIPALAFVNTSFTKHLALANGIVTTGNSLGGIIFPILFRHLQPSIGFPWTTRVIGFLQAGLATVAGILLIDAPVAKHKPRSFIDVQALKSGSFLCMGGVFFCNFLSYWVPIFFIPIFGSSKLRMSPRLSAYMVCITNAGSIFGRFIPAVLPKSIGPFNIVLACIFVSTIVTFCWLAIETVAGYIVWAAIWGMVTGVFISINPVAVAHPILSPGMEVYGTRLGMLTLSSAIGTLIGLPIAGALADPDTGDFDRAQILSGVVMFGAFLFAIWPWFESRRYFSGRKSTQEHKS